MRDLLPANRVVRVGEHCPRPERKDGVVLFGMPFTKAAANAALKFQNDRIQALGPAAGVGFSPAAGYQTGLGGVQAGNSLAGSSLASIGYGLTGQGNSAASMPPWLQAYLIQNGIGGTHV